MSPINESELVQKAAGGDRDAFAQLLERYQKKIYHHTLRMLGNPDDAADVTQDIFLLIWTRLPSFQGSSSFSTWLYLVTKNRCIDFIRRERRHRGDLSLDDEERDLSAVLPDTSLTPQDALEQSELRRTVQEGLDSLSDAHRQVLVLREIDGLSYEEIGQLLDLSPGTVKSRIARARLALAKFLRKSGNFSDPRSST